MKDIINLLKGFTKHEKILILFELYLIVILIKVILT